MKESIYLFNRASDMINLAVEIQSQVYWGGYFDCRNTQEEVPWREFWSYLKSYEAEGYNGVRITDNGIVRFMVIV